MALTLSTLTNLAAITAKNAANHDEQLAFFESKVRPVLAGRCYKCHSSQAEKLKAGLRLDTRAGWVKGGDTGPAIVPGHPEKSLLVKAIRYQDPDLQMPPKRKLTDDEIAVLVDWVAMGAPDPRTERAASFPSPSSLQKHWSFQPIRHTGLPEVKNRSWVRSPIDAFVLAQLETNGLTPSPPAGRRTLIRRAFFDLIGLPPSFEEVEAFVRDPSPDAFARVVDRLLSSPQYGERWGRHWLDVARYVDTKDLVLLFGKDRIRPYAYTYRDYVVRAFNADLPFDQFVEDQLAADQTQPPREPWRLAAMGFLTLGRLYDNNLQDIYDDQIDTVTRGLLGLTVACARCHDHKYDPIPTGDYYALYGVFASSERPLDLPIIEDSKKIVGAEDFEKKWAAKRQELQDHVEAQFKELSETARLRVVDYLVKAATEKPDPLEDSVFFLSLSPEDLRPQFTSRWRRFLLKNARPNDPIFGPWHEFMQLRDDEFEAKAEAIAHHWTTNECGIADGQVNPLVQHLLAATRFSCRRDVARAYGDLFKQVYQQSQTTAGKAGEGSTAEAERQILAILTGQESPVHFLKRNAYLYMSRVPREKYGSLVQALDKLAVDATNAPARAMVLVDSSEPYDPRIFIRGSAGNPGPKVPRQFLRLIRGPENRPFPHGSGRLDLARALTAPDNPLTARVLANRVWMHHFGEPLVSTPSDFGTRSTPPTHPALLDYLAWSLQHDGWSLKKLHRLILLSNTYQQSSRDRPEGRRTDPDNRLLWRFNRRRLDLEAMRDTLLAVAGRLDPAMGGRPVDVAGDPANRRRTAYGLVDRQDLPALYRAFDFANPDQSADRRPQTIVPQQALFALNSPFVLEQAKALAARSSIAADTDEAQRVTALYHLVLGRDPNGDETRSALRFVHESQADSSLSPDRHLRPWQQYAQVLLLTNELMFID